MTPEHTIRGALRPDGPLAAFDCETTGADPAHARLVTVALACQDAPDRTPRADTWTINPGVPIPAEASAVHGVTDAMVADAPAEADVVGPIADTLRRAWATGIPVCIFNAPYDLAVLGHALARGGHPPLPAPADCHVVDPLVLDRVLDRYRPGRRTLGALMSTYGVPAHHAHRADTDAVATLTLARVIACRYPQIATLDLRELHEMQRRGHARWAAGYQRWRRRDPAEAGFVCDDAWPYRPARAAP